MEIVLKVFTYNHSDFCHSFHCKKEGLIYCKRRGYELLTCCEVECLFLQQMDTLEHQDEQRVWLH